MAEQSPIDTINIGNAHGEGNFTINTISVKLDPSDAIPNNLVSAIKDHLTGLEKPLRSDWTTTAIMMAFGAYCILLLVPLVLLIFKGFAVTDIQSITLSGACAMSGITGLLGVILGWKLKPFVK